jgi:type IX secretion system PorP/SprF family membrane protein
MIKKLVCMAALAVMAQGVTAQQRPHYTQYILNNYIVNPALSGIENYTDVKVSHRHQWVGFSGRPVTTYLSVQGPIGKKDYRTTPTSFRVPGENPRGKSYWEEYSAPAPHHGLGVIVMTDKTGSFSRFDAQATYAYHLGIGPKTSLSAGVAAGIQSISLDRG